MLELTPTDFQPTPLCSALTPCVHSIWLLFRFFWLRFLVACSLPTHLFPPSTHCQESRAPRTPILQTRFLPLTLPRLPMRVMFFTSGVCKFRPCKDSTALHVYLQAINAFVQPFGFEVIGNMQNWITSDFHT